MEVDRCTALHGIWFDPEELQAVLNASNKGAGVHLAPVTLGPQEEHELKRIERESKANSAESASNWASAGDAIILVAEVVAAFFD